MNYELPCEIVEDLLPSYIDNLTNKLTEQSVAEHLAHCTKCSKMYKAMKENNETNNIIIDDQKLLKKSKKKIKKKITISIIIAVLVTAIIVTAAYGVWYAYWGRRHSVLYDVQCVYVSQDVENENIYHLKYNVKVKNWPLDFEHHTYKLRDSLPMSYNAKWNFKGESDYFTTSSTETYFEINAEFDMNAYDNSPKYEYIGYEPTLEEKLKTIITSTEFSAYDENDLHVDGASLYMLDNVDTEIIIK